MDATVNNQAPADPFSELKARFTPQFAEASERLKSLIRTNPGTCLLGAAMLGFIIGKWASR